MSDHATARWNSLVEAPYVLHGVITEAQRAPNAFMIQVADCDVDAYGLRTTHTSEPPALVILNAPYERWTRRLLFALACADMHEWVGHKVLFMLEQVGDALIAVHLDMDTADRLTSTTGNFYIKSLAGN